MDAAEGPWHNPLTGRATATDRHWGATPGSRDSSRGSQDARRAISNSFRRGGLGGSTPTWSQRGHQALLAGRGAQGEAISPRPLPLGAAPISQHSSATPQDAHLALGTPVQRGHLRGSTSASSQQECRAALGGDRAHGVVGPRPSPPLSAGVTAGCRDSITPPR